MYECHRCHERLGNDERVVRARQLGRYQTQTGFGVGDGGERVMFHERCWYGDSASYQALDRGTARELVGR